MPKKIRPELEDCPPSSSAVLDVLESAEEPLGPEEIQERTGFARRTVFLALKCLEQMKAVIKGMTLRDARRRRYIAAKDKEE